MSEGRRMNDTGKYEWSAFDRNRCDHFYHNGQQIRFYRTRPWPQDYEAFEPRWWERILNWLIGVK